MFGCPKCKAVSGLLLMALGIAFLLRDFNIWAFWNVQWWSALIFLAGLIKFCQSRCADCCCSMDMSKKRK